MIGYSRADLEAGIVDWVKATPEEWFPRDLQSLEELRKYGKCKPYEKEYVRPDGTRVPILIGAATLTREPTLTWICFAADLTEQKKLERELQVANQRLAFSNEELQKFAHVVAHDLQSPLRTMSSMTMLLGRRLENQIDFESKNLIRQVEAGVRRASKLISDLLDYCRVPDGINVQRKTIDCSMLFNWTLMNLHAKIIETGAVITSDDLPEVQADDQLLRVFQNLIENALKYRGGVQPRVHVSARHAGAEWVISVRDNGIGMDMRFGDRIFGVFQRLHSSDQYEGTGMGLAICRKIIESYGGRIWVQSATGEGSTFHFSIPAV
jgi:light-regulated signal transduction histidine kinase (bacteriophytochrome)